MKEERKKFCYHCKKLKSIDEFRSAGYTRKGTKTFKSKCRKCEGFSSVRGRPPKNWWKKIKRIIKIKKRKIMKKKIQQYKLEPKFKVLKRKGHLIKKVKLIDIGLVKRKNKIKESIIRCVAGEDIRMGDFLFFNPENGRVYKI